ncbi:uncharacterized protein BKA55DRAFT_346201 [Fusarium redolens]|uniref:Uncharacterized protein n=1 Tax=Fusarium redolens TaxID=48865 RepID=A0A9P9HC01_FUSRE|nr:uncharacterized protein BKA55DRAFT_346201 [Fusarium redolens]KAH7253897.1 hypothetical protein BKA55DRAFT_346201 [Fusarium redolens]
MAPSVIVTLGALSIRLSQFLVTGHLGQIKNSLVSTHHQLPERGSAVSTPRELPEIQSRTNDGPEFGRDLSRVRENFSSNLTPTLRDCRPTTATSTHGNATSGHDKMTRMDEYRMSLGTWYIVQIVDQLPHSIRYLQ